MTDQSINAGNVITKKCGMCQQEIIRSDVAYFAETEEGYDIVVCRDCYDRTLGRLDTLKANEMEGLK
jgi:hypothetical protein